MGLRNLGLLFASAASSLIAQTMCAPTPVYSPCEIGFDLSPADAATHRNPYLSVDLHAEFRSPRHRTFLAAAFWDGGNRLVIRFTPNEPGDWTLRVTSNIAAYNDKELKFTAAASDSPGFVQAANVHHFSYTAKNQPHLWIGDVIPNFAALDRAGFEQLVTTRAQQKFNHLRVTLLDSQRPVRAPDQIDPVYFRELDSRILYINQKGMIADVAITGGNGVLTRLFPEREQRERLVRYLVSRYAPFNITWHGVDAFETYENGRELLKEIAGYLKSADPYQHIRSTGTLSTSGPLADDGWLGYLTYQSTDDAVGAIEHQLYGAPQVATWKSADTDSFRKRLWNSAMNGAYPQPQAPDDEAGRQMAVWANFFSGTRHWELEPFFDVTGGRGLALEDVEYIIYVETPGPVDVHLDEKRNYDLAWINPISGEEIALKNLKSDRFTGEPPDHAHDWVLHISREGHKAGMIKGYKFESRPTLLQEVTSDPQKLPFDIVQPAGEKLSISKPAPYEVKLKKEGASTRTMMYLWTVEVTADEQSYRVVGAGKQGMLQIPANIARRFPASLHLRLIGMNAFGKIYITDRNYELTQ